MSKIQLSFFSAVIGFSFLTGCANKDKIDQISSDIQDISNKTDQIEKNLNTINNELQSVKEETNRANQRLDNQVANYKK